MRDRPEVPGSTSCAQGKRTKYGVETGMYRSRTSVEEPRASALGSRVYRPGRHPLKADFGSCCIERRPPITKKYPAVAYYTQQVKGLHSVPMGEWGFG